METEMSYGSDYHYLPITSIESGSDHTVTPDLLGLTVQIVNVYYVGMPESGDWVLVDAGMPGSSDKIIETAEERFRRPPSAILLTHGHFDHVGSLIELVRYWKVPVYAHVWELPYLTGQKPYMAPDPTVDGGLVAKMSGWFPNEPINLGRHIHSLPDNESVPYLPGWKWLHTGGHTPGHISLFKESTRTLIAGDAFVTVRQESVYKVFTQELELNGPPKYFTSDWQAAKKSVEKLEALKPAIAVTGHGLPMSGELLAASLSRLVSQFETVAVPHEKLQ